MHFALTEEQEQLQEVARSFLSDVPGPREPDPGTWGRIVEEQGWPAVAVPEAYGGWGYGLLELAVVFEELGRALVPSPMLASSMAMHAVALGGEDGQKEAWLADFAAGVSGTLAWEGDLRARREGAEWLLAGTAERVLDAATAEVVVVATSDGVFVVRGSSLDRSEVGVIDGTRPMGRIQFDGVRLPDSARLRDDVLAPAQAVGQVLLAAECVGGAEACLDMAVEYAKVRKQFGKPIGSFQAVKHMCADMLVDVESARSAVWYAAWALQEGADDAQLAVHTAKAMACDAFFRCAGTNIQVHGGIGFTWECDAHLYFKRARAARALLGEPAAHRAAVAAEVLA